VKGRVAFIVDIPKVRPLSPFDRNACAACILGGSPGTRICRDTSAAIVVLLVFCCVNANGNIVAEAFRASY